MLTKEKIMQETLKIMAEKGIAALSLGDVSSAVGIKKPSLYAHFPSKKALIDASLAYAAALQTSFPFSIDLTKTPKEILFSATQHYISLYCNAPLCYYFSIAESTKFSKDDKLREKSELFQDTLETQFALLFETFDETGKIIIADTDTAAFLFASAFRTILCENITRTDTRQLEFETERFVNSFLNFIR